MFLLFFCTIIQAQNPFEKFGYEPKIGTLSKGKYIEHFDNDSIVRIGNVLFNTYTNNISAFAKIDTLYTEANLDPTLISRWMNPDPLSDEFPDKSPYNFVNNNPLRFVDPLGLAPEDIIINFLDADGNKQQINYEYGGTYDGDNQFVKDVFQALNYLVENNADVAGTIKTLSGDELGDVNVYENTKENNKRFDKPKDQTYFTSIGQNSGEPEIIWGSRQGAEFTNTKGFISWLMGDGYEEEGQISPAETLLHELGHAESFLRDPKQHAWDSNYKLNSVYRNQEEYDVITKIENPASLQLNHIKRRGHYGRFYKVKSPISIEKL